MEAGSCVLAVANDTSRDRAPKPYAFAQHGSPFRILLQWRSSWEANRNQNRGVPRCERLGLSPDAPGPAVAQGS